MAKITDTVKVLLIINVIFYLASQFVIAPDRAMELFALWYFEHPAFELWQPVTHMFMHDLGSPMHIIFNMYALWMFGGPIENALGRNKFIFFYFSAGLGAAFIHSLVNYIDFHDAYQYYVDAGYTVDQMKQILAQSVSPGYGVPLENIPEDITMELSGAFNVPAVGASGAIYGVLVAFGMLFPNASLGLIFIPIPIKAKYFIPALILIDLFSGLTGFSIFGANIANWAHLGGALFGFIMMYYWKKNSFNKNRWD